MPTPAERKALLFLSGVILLGASVRVVRAARDEGSVDAASRDALARQIAAVDSAADAPPRARRSSRPRRRAPSPARSAPTPANPDLRAPRSEPTSIDLDVASAAEIEALPRIGPVLAQRIVDDRMANGPFGSMDEFQRVRGVGPALARALAARVTFSGTARPANAVVQPGLRSTNTPKKSPRRAPRQ